MENIKDIRLKTKLSQNNFASEYNIPVRTIQKWERNGSTPPSYIPELIDRVIFLENTELFMECYWRDEITATVRLDEQFAYIKRLSTHPAKQLFWSDKITRYEFGEILCDRCWDKSRPDLTVLLSSLGLTDFNPYEICKRTHGRMVQDSIWFRFPGELLTYKDLKYV